MRYIHLRARTRHDRSDRGETITATVQVANDLTDQLSSDDGIVLQASAFASETYPHSPEQSDSSDVNISGGDNNGDHVNASTAVDIQDSPSCYRSEAVKGSSRESIEVPWISNKQCVPVSVSIANSGGKQTRKHPVQVHIRGILPNNNQAGALNKGNNAKNQRGAYNNRSKVGNERMGTSAQQRGSPSSGVEPDIISFNPRTGKMVFPSIISVRTAIFEPAPLSRDGGNVKEDEAGMAQRVIRLPGGQIVEIWEDVLSSEYWASVWDAGLALSAYLSLHSSPWRNTILAPIRAVLDLSIPSPQSAPPAPSQSARDIDPNRDGRADEVRVVDGKDAQAQSKNQVPDQAQETKTALSQPSRLLTGIELGCGCGILGISLHLAVPNSDILVTDLPESGPLVEKNIRQARARLELERWEERQRRKQEELEVGEGNAAASGAGAANEPSASTEFSVEKVGHVSASPSDAHGRRDLSTAAPEPKPNLAFAPLDWFAPIPESVLARKHDLIFLSDCTYNTDTIPPLVATLQKLAAASSSSSCPSPSSSPSSSSSSSSPSQSPTSSSHSPLILVGRKIRHQSERTFETQMAAAGFVPGETDRIDLPGNGSALPWMVVENTDDGDGEGGEDPGDGTGKGEVIEVMTYRYRPQGGDKEEEVRDGTGRKRKAAAAEEK